MRELKLRVAGGGVLVAGWPFRCGPCVPCGRTLTSPLADRASTATATAGVPDRTARRSRSLRRPRSRASPTSTRDAGASVPDRRSKIARTCGSSMTGSPFTGGIRAGVRVQRPAQGCQALDGLALDGPGGAAENLRGLLDVQVAVEPQD